VGYEISHQPEPGPGQLVVRCRANALCGSDRGAYLQGSAVVPGHEVAGEVVAAGPDVHVAVGSRGVVFLMAFCGRCRSCRAGATNLCEDKAGDTGFNLDGGLGPFAVVEASRFFLVDKDVPFALATVLLDVMGTSSHALDRILSVRDDVGSVAITGAGPVGLGALMMARIRFGDDVPVYISDVSQWRLQLAERLGGIPVDAADPRTLPEVDAAIDASGRQNARRLALSRLGRRGVLACVGHGEQLIVDVSSELIAKQVSVLGSEYFPYAALSENYRLLRQHRDYLDQIITHQFDLSETKEAFEVFLSGRTGKVVVVQDGADGRAEGVA
jgi:threonine dehydrogenase-like Zn-dependent dehydrogenase